MSKIAWMALVFVGTIAAACSPAVTGGGSGGADGSGGTGGSGGSGGARGSGGAGGDACMQAQAYLATCFGETTASSSGSGTEPACSGAYLCQSKCINASTCDEISSNADDYGACIFGCKGQ